MRLCFMGEGDWIPNPRSENWLPIGEIRHSCLKSILGFREGFIWLKGWKFEDSCSPRISLRLFNSWSINSSRRLYLYSKLKKPRIYRHWRYIDGYSFGFPLWREKEPQILKILFKKWRIFFIYLISEKWKDFKSKIS